MALTTTELAVVLTAETNKYLYVSLHTADPGTTGTSEVTGGAPAYARKAAAWTVSGTVASCATVTFDVPPGQFAYFGLWSASSGGTFYGGNPLAATITKTGQSTVQVAPTIAVTAS